MNYVALVAALQGFENTAEDKSKARKGDVFEEVVFRHSSHPLENEDFGLRLENFVELDDVWDAAEGDQDLDFVINEFRTAFDDFDCDWKTTVENSLVNVREMADTNAFTVDERVNLRQLLEDLALSEAIGGATAVFKFLDFLL
jgi:hypothetical protein